MGRRVKEPQPGDDAQKPPEAPLTAGCGRPRVRRTCPTLSRQQWKCCFALWLERREKTLKLVPGALCDSITVVIDKGDVIYIYIYIHTMKYYSAVKKEINMGLLWWSSG